MDLYATLSIPRNADAATIRKAYRRASKKAHPDGGGSAEAFRNVSRALEVLSDPVRRKAYDETGRIEDRPVDNTQAELMQTVSAMLDQVLGGCDQARIPWDHANLIQRMIDAIKTRRQQIVQQRRAFKDAADRQRKIAKKFRKRGDGANLMETLITGRIAFLEGQDAMMQRQMDALAKAEEFIKQYEFDAEMLNPRQTAAMAQSFFNEAVFRTS